MRKITENAIAAFNKSEKFNSGNTEVENNNGIVTLYLHGNAIAVNNNGNLRITTAGWNTPTTKERLNGLSGVNVYQKNKKLFLNGKEWNGEWITVIQ